MQRRTFLGLGAGLFGGALLAGWQLGRRDGQPLLLSARNDSQGRHYAVGYGLDGSQRFATEVAQRCHDVVPHPYLSLALFVARRPGTQSYLIDTRDGRLVQTLDSPANRHFYGHAVFHHSGDWLYSTENDTRDPGRGVLGVYRVSQGRLERSHELSTHGIGPHQLLWMPDGETLVVANGGIRTEAESREAMNLDAMDSSLVLLDRQGRLLSRDRLAQPLNSIRHLAVASDGTVVSSQQYKGEPGERSDLLAIKRPGQALQPFPMAPPQWQAMSQYTASVAVHSELRLLAASAPRGNRLLIWDLDSAELRLDLPLPDCAGVAAVPQGFVATSGQARCRLIDCHKKFIDSTPLQLPAALWDNHLRVA